jgi:phosphopantothenoylcysteine decarboxylase/phosphopantothenate--cysteine ligase
VRIVLGVSGGIAAYKSASLLRLLTEAGHDVRVVPTTASLEFVGRATWEALSGQPAPSDVFDDVPGVEHVRLGAEADLVVVAPATADLLARAAGGRADDLLTATLLTAGCPVLMVPAMHTQMWLHAATQANVATLRERGVHVLEPDEGRLTGRDSGVGRMPEPEVIAAVASALMGPQDLAGRRVVVTAGGTREALDPVRFLGNRSSGRQGVALARAAAFRGADVVLVAANVAVDGYPGVTVRPVESAGELQEAVRKAALDADVVVMAAAVADFRPVTVAEQKLKKADVASVTVELAATDDILTELVTQRRDGQIIVGFAAETGDGDGSVLEHGRAKALRKGADLMVVNAVGPGRGFAVEVNDVTILDSRGERVAHRAGTKDEVAHAVWDVVVPMLGPAAS